MRNVTFHPLKNVTFHPLCIAAALLLLAVCSADAAPTIQTPLVLINANAGSKTNFVNGATLKQGVTYKLRAPANSQTRSVRLQMDGNALPIQNMPPYDFVLPGAIGSHSGWCTPFAKDNGRGFAGKAVSINFKVAKPSPTPTPTPKPTATPTPASPTPSPTTTPIATPSPSATITPTPTPTPTAGSIGLKWDASPGATGYKIYFGTAPGRYFAPVDVGNVTSARVPNLAIGTTYYLAITAYNASAESAKSTEVSGQPGQTLAIKKRNEKTQRSHRRPSPHRN